MASRRSSTTQAQTTQNTFTDESTNAGGDNSLAIGSGAALESIGGDKLTTGDAAQITITDASPEALQAAFEFGRDALEALSANTDRQVSGAVDAARQASEAAARSAAAQGAASALASATPPAPTLPRWAWAAGLGVVALVAFLLLRSPSRR